MRWKFGRRRDEIVEEAQPFEPTGAPVLSEPEPSEPEAFEASKPSEPAVVKGFFRGGELLVSGWILDLEDSRRKRTVDIFIGEKRVGSARADRFDAVVQSHHGGDGHFAFVFYYDGELENSSVKAGAVESETGTPLRSKQPIVSGSLRSGPPLAVEKLVVGERVELFVRVGAYPLSSPMTLEFWSGDQRTVSAIPLSPADDNDDGLLSARLEGDALKAFVAGPVELALPGLKEAGLAIPVEDRPLQALVTKQGDHLSLRLSGEFEKSGPIPLTLRFKGSGDGLVERDIVLQSGEAAIGEPAGFQFANGALEVLLGGIALPADLGWSSLGDPRFDSLGQKDSPWRLSGNATAERGFFAFPERPAGEHRLSGRVAHVSGESGEPLRLSQAIADAPAGDVTLSFGAFVRASKGAGIAVRLRDDEGVLAESTATARSSDSWSLQRIEKKLDRRLSGGLVFEVEVAGPHSGEFDIALADSIETTVEAADPGRSNLIANGDFQHWPSGAGTQSHSMRGELCAGWHFLNHKTSDPIFAKAVMHPSDGSLGLAVAAPVVNHYLRVESRVKGDFTERPLVLRFRAGVPASARQLLAREAGAVPQFAVLDRVQLIRRIIITSGDDIEHRQQVVGIFERKIPVAAEIEQFDYSLPPIDEPEPVQAEKGEQVEESYHLAFDFRQPTVIALFDVELVAADPVAGQASHSRLLLEDRNIELQVATLETVQHWRGPAPVRLASAEPSADTPGLKWSAGTAREPVEIVIPVFNALDETLDCLDSLGRSSTVPILVRLVDDGSDPQVSDALEAYASDKPWIQVNRLSGNRGYTFAADHGIRSCATDWVVLLNSDTIVTQGWLEGMLQCARSDPAIAMVGPLSNAASYQSVPVLYDASRKWKVNSLPPGMTPDDMAAIVRRLSLKGCPEVPLLNGFCTLMRRSVFIELGGLNPAAFPAGYGEENDLCLRAAKAGFKLAIADDVYVYHVKSASFGNARRQDLTRGGNAALRKLHPDVDIGALTASLRETPELVTLRQAVAEEISRSYAPASVDADHGEPGGDEQGAAETRPKSSDPEGLKCA